MTITTSLRRVIAALWTAFALVIALTTGQPEMAVPLYASPAQSQAGDWEKEISSWRAQHAVELQKPDGWLALAGLEWLEPGDNSVGSAKENKIHLPSGGPAHLGVLRLESETITLNPPEGGFPAGFFIDGKPVQMQKLDNDPQNAKNTPRRQIRT